MLTDTSTETMTVTVQGRSGAVTLHRLDLSDEQGYDDAATIVRLLGADWDRVTGHLAHERSRFYEMDYMIMERVLNRSMVLWRQPEGPI